MEYLAVGPATMERTRKLLAIAGARIKQVTPHNTTSGWGKTVVDTGDLKIVFLKTTSKRKNGKVPVLKLKVEKDGKAVGFVIPAKDNGTKRTQSELDTAIQWNKLLSEAKERANIIKAKDNIKEEELWLDELVEEVCG
jgi:hypothetical protein